jgi:uncharacterized protein (DUF433 family)
MGSHALRAHVPVSMIVGSVADGMSFDEIIDSYPQLKKESVQAVLEMI